jgi:hypothetical protein
MSDCSCCGEELVAAMSAVAMILTQGKTAEEVKILSVELSLLSSATNLIATQRAICEAQNAVLPH